MSPRSAVAVATALARAFAAGPSAGEARTLQEPPVAKLVGQSILTGVDGRTPSASLLARVRAGEVGGVILFAGNIGTNAQLARLIAELQGAAEAGGNPALLVAIDQEGGSVKRLPQGPPDRSAAAMGRDGTAADARAQGRATGDYLRGRGIDVDLAPVLDTPATGASFLGSRAFSRDPRL